MKKSSIKKIVLIIVTFTLLLSAFSGCKQKVDLTNDISELRYDILVGQNENFTVKGECYERETPRFKDGEIKEKTNCFVLTLTNCNLNVTYTASFTQNGINYSQKFNLSPTNSKLQATFNAKVTAGQLTVKINGGSVNETIELKSIVPNGAKDYKTALNSLLESQPSLINKYMLDGKFQGEIAVRLLVEKQKAYYYIGLTDTSKNTTALLIDADTLEVLAIRKVFG